MSGLLAAVSGGSAMILLAFLLRLLLKDRLPRRLFPALWCAAALRLLLPVPLPARISLWNLLRSTPGPAAGGVISSTALPFPALLQAAGEGAASTAAVGRISPLLLVWFAGTALLGAYFGIGYACMVRRLHAVRLSPQASVDALLQCFRFSRRPQICVSQSRRAPLTYGIFRPTVLLPADLDPQTEPFRLVFAHELAHIRRRDCLRKLLITVCLCLYWWNPLVWLMVRLAGCDMELACDEAVLRTLGTDCRKAYALTLLDMAQRKQEAAPLCSGFARSSTEQRIRAVLRFRPIPGWVGICAAIFFALSAGVLATQAASPAAPAPGPAPQEAPLRRAEAAPVREDIPITAAADTPAFVWPLEDADAAVVNPFGVQEHPLLHTTSFHGGVDLAAEAGSSVLAAADGTVVSCENDEAYGYLLTLAHADGIQTRYGHLQEFLVQPGDTVAQGQVVALTGDTGWTTGPHLHLSVLRSGELVDPLDALKSS